MAEHGPIPSDEGDAGIEDDVVDGLRRSNPVDAATLPSSRSAEAARTLEQILTPDDGSECDESSPSPARDQDGREEPPPRPASR